MDNDEEIVREDNEEQELDASVLEIVSKAENEKKLSAKEMEKLIAQAKESIEFMKKLDDIKLECDTFVVYIDGNDQLVYDNGEFFICSTIDSKKEKKKLKKQEAKDLYIEYFIKYQLNPIIKQRKIQEQKENIKQTQINKKPQSVEKEAIKAEKKPDKEKTIKATTDAKQPKTVAKNTKKEDIIR